jgi:hypothetical protein
MVKACALILAIGWGSKGEANSVRLAADLSLQSSVRVPMKVPRALEGRKLQIQVGGLTAENPPEVIFQLQLLCRSSKATYHLGYLNFFNAIGQTGRELTFAFDLPDLTDLPCPPADLYLAIKPEGAVAPGSFPRVKFVNLLASGPVSSTQRD